MRRYEGFKRNTAYGLSDGRFVKDGSVNCPSKTNFMSLSDSRAGGLVTRTLT